MLLICVHPLDIMLGNGFMKGRLVKIKDVLRASALVRDNGWGALWVMTQKILPYKLGQAEGANEAAAHGSKCCCHGVLLSRWAEQPSRR